MLTIQNYVRAESLEQAYELNQKKSSRIIGGMLWLKMTHIRVQNAIDLGGLGLNTIEETPEMFRIGCMTTLRDLELHEGLNTWTQGAIRESVCHIVGVQFRNLATVGGSIYGRYGFSDVLTVFQALNARVELFSAGILPIEEYARMPKDRDILVRILVPKTPVTCTYLSVRKTKTDFPVLTCAAARTPEEFTLSIGARPGRAIRIQEPDFRLSAGTIPEEDIRTFAEEISQRIVTGSNMRAGAEYRTHLAKVLTRRALLTLKGDDLP